MGHEKHFMSLLFSFFESLRRLSVLLEHVSHGERMAQGYLEIWKRGTDLIFTLSTTRESVRTLALAEEGEINQHAISSERQLITGLSILLTK